MQDTLFLENHAFSSETAVLLSENAFEDGVGGKYDIGFAEFVAIFSSRLSVVYNNLAERGRETKLRHGITTRTGTKTDLETCRMQIYFVLPLHDSNRRAVKRTIGR